MKRAKTRETDGRVGGARRRMVPGLVAFLAVTATGVGAQVQVASADASGASGGDAARAVTFTQDVAPILQEHCQQCHHDGGVAPMALETYQQVRRYASRIKERTGRRDRMGAMPPYYIERGIGIQHYKDDQRLSESEIQTLATWVDSGTPEGDPAAMPAAKTWPKAAAWAFGEPDVVVRSQDFHMKAGAPDWWGNMDPIDIPLTEDRYVRAVQVREINDITGEGGGVGGLYIVHHTIWGTIDPEGHVNQSWPVHELGRNPDIFDDDAAEFLAAGSKIVSSSVHLNAAATDATGHLEFGFYLEPEGYKPKYTRVSSVGAGLGDGMNIDIRPEQDDQVLHAFSVLQTNMKIVSFEPHLHAPGKRACLEAIWGNFIETLACSGYDHNWVKQYTFAEDYAPLLPKGTVLHLMAWMDNTDDNTNIPDPRNWQGSGNRSVSNMFIDLGKRVMLTDEQFVDEMATRREHLGVTKNDHVIGCPLCLADIPRFSDVAQQQGQQGGGQQQ